MCCEAVLGLPTPPLTLGPDAVRRDIYLDPVPPSVGVARRFVREVLSDVPRDELDTALLMASELVTNAILHARTPVELGVLLDDGRLLLCVGDRLPGGPLTPRSHSRDRPGGRGLALVADLSENWGTVGTAGGKTVWFTLPVSVRVECIR